MIRIASSARCVVLATLASAVTVSALTIKLATTAPTGSPWDKAVRKISAEWKGISGGSIDIKVYPGGVSGDESDMIRKMRINQIDAAAISGIGLSRIYNGILAIHLPMVIKDDDELNFVLGKMQGHYEKKLADQGYVVLCWTKVGWAHFFGKKPIVTPDDMRPMKMFVTAGDDDATMTWKENGFKPVPLSGNDLMTSLQSGMIDAFTTTPLAAAASQWFGMAKNMCGLKWAPVLGAVVITKKSWEKIPEAIRPQLMSSARKIGASMQTEIDAADNSAIEIMKKNGLTVSTVPQSAADQWKVVAENGAKSTFDKCYDAESYNMIMGYLKEYRLAKKSK